MRGGKNAGADSLLRNKKFLRVLVITLVLMPSIATASRFFFQSQLRDITWILVDDTVRGYSIRPMAFTDPNEEAILFGGMSGIYIYNTFDNNVSGPYPINNGSWFKGAYDIEPVWGGWSHLFVSGDKNGSLYIGNYPYQTKQVEFERVLIRNISSDVRFECVEFYMMDSQPRIFLGSNTYGIFELDYETRGGSFINMTNGLASNSIRCLQVRGDILLAGTSRGFSFFNLKTGANFSCLFDDIGDDLIVDCIEYYQLTHKIYVGTENGLFIFKENGANATLVRSRLTTADGLPARGINVFGLDMDQKRLYIGTYGGLCYISLDENDQSIVPMISREHITIGRWPEHVRSILIPRYTMNNVIYLGTANGYIVKVPTNYNPNTMALLIRIQNIMYIIAGAFLVLIWSWYCHNPYSQKPEDLHNLRTEELINMGESEFIEFKSSLMWDYQSKKANKELIKPVIKTICGFMNSHAGVLLIGVNDNGEILGLEKDYSLLNKKNSDGFELQLTTYFNNLTGGASRNYFRVLFHIIDGKEVCRVNVSPAPEPVFMGNHNDRKLYIREGGSTRHYDQETTLKYIKRKWKGRI